MSAISGVSQITDMSQLLSLMVTRSPAMDAANLEAMAALEANLAALQESQAALASGTSLDVVA